MATGSTDTLLDACVDHDRLLGLSMTTLLSMKGQRVHRHAGRILGFLEHRGVEDPVGRYLERTRELGRQQQKFEARGRYAAAAYTDVPAVDLEDYNLALLLSFVVTVHRFEILERLLDFLAAPCTGPRRLLSVGYGTGYELALTRERLPDWELEAFERSPEGAAYARDLLDFFGHSTDGLRLEDFPLEHERGLGGYERRYGKAVLCELLEHLERPAHALRNLRRVLHPRGRAFLTMAINIAQEDHIHLYRTPQDARRQVREAGLRPVQEWIAPVTVLPFAEADRNKVFRKGNYICIAAPA